MPLPAASHRRCPHVFFDFLSNWAGVLLWWVLRAPATCARVDLVASISRRGSLGTWKLAHRGNASYIGRVQASMYERTLETAVILHPHGSARVGKSWDGSRHFIDFLYGVGWGYAALERHFMQIRVGLVDFWMTRRGRGGGGGGMNTGMGGRHTGA